MSRNDCGSWLACDADARVYQAVRVDALAGKPAPTERSGQAIEKLSVGIDQGTEHFVRSLGDFRPQLDLKLALGHFHHVARRVGRLGAVIGLQTVALRGRRLGGRGAGNLAGRLVDAVLPGLNSAQARIKRAASRDVHGVSLPL